MINNLTELQEEIKSKLLTLWWPSWCFANIYETHWAWNNWYPSVSFLEWWYNSETNSSCDDKITYIFDFIIYQEFNTISEIEARSIIRNCHNQLLTLFLKNPTLNWKIINISNISWVMDTLVDETNTKLLVYWQTFWFEILLNINN